MRYLLFTKLRLKHIIFSVLLLVAWLASSNNSEAFFNPEDRDQALSFLSELFYATVTGYPEGGLNTGGGDLPLQLYMKSAKSDLYLDDYTYINDTFMLLGTPYELNFKIRVLGNNSTKRWSTSEDRWVTFATQNVMPINELMQPGTFRERTGGRENGTGRFIGTVGTTWHGEFAASQGDIISTVDASRKFNATKWIMAEIAAACWEGYGPYTYKGRAPNGSDSKYKNSWYSDWYKIEGTFNGDRGPGLGIPGEDDPPYGRYHIYEAIYSPSYGEYGFEDSGYTDSTGKRMPKYGALRYNPENGSYANNTTVTDNAENHPRTYKVLLDCNSQEEAMRKNLHWLLTQKKYLYMAPIHATDTMDISTQLREDQYGICYENCYDDAYNVCRHGCNDGCHDELGGSNDRCDLWYEWIPCGPCISGCAIGCGTYSAGRATYCAGKCAVEGMIIHSVNIKAETEIYYIRSINVNGIEGALTSHRSGTTIADNAVWGKSGVNSNYHQFYLNEHNYFLNLVDEGDNTYRFKDVSFDEADYLVATDYKYYIDFSGDFWGLIDLSVLVGAMAKSMTNVTELIWNQCGDGPVLWPPKVPLSPSPSDGSIDNSVNVTLSWQSWQGTDLYPGEIEFYEVCLDSNSWPQNRVSYNQSNTSYSATNLEYGTTYYWRIVALTSENFQVWGAVWSFTTFSASGDADTDGLTNEQEITIDTNPFNPDTDGDGLNDGEEVNTGSNPSDQDSDGDGFEDLEDNCRNIANADQADSDGDGLGDACDTCPNDADNDADGDGVCGDLDNCPNTTNPGQEEADNDGLGNACDACPNDPDNDADGDGMCGDVDNCPGVSNADQGDADNDGLGDVCDSDIDGDGIHNAVDKDRTTFSDEFSDVDLGGITKGTITDRGNQVVTVTDEAVPDGVRITALAGTEPATVSVCGGSAIITLVDGDEVFVTCSSVTIEVVSGTVEIMFVAADGTTATTSLGQGNSLIFEPITFTITAPSSNTEDVAILVNGEEISLAAGDTVSNLTRNTQKAKVCWHHDDLHVEGRLYLPEGFWADNLNPVGNAVITLAGVEVADQSVDFEIKGKKGDKWEYKDKKNLNGNIKEFKIDWKEAKFDYKGDDKFHIHTHFISGTETALCIHTGDVSEAFMVTIDETTIEYDEDRNITTYPYLLSEPQKGDNTHVHFTLPFQLTSEMTIEVSDAMELTIDVADYYKGGYAKFKLVSIFNSRLIPDGSGALLDELEYKISLGDGVDMISASDLIGDEKVWTKKDHKHWEYK